MSTAQMSPLPQLLKELIWGSMSQWWQSVMVGRGQSEKCHWQGDVCEAGWHSHDCSSGHRSKCQLGGWRGKVTRQPREPAERVEATLALEGRKSNLNNNTWGWQKDLPGVHAFLWRGEVRESLTPFPEDFWLSYGHLLLEREPYPYRIQFHLGVVSELPALTRMFL